MSEIEDNQFYIVVKNFDGTLGLVLSEENMKALQLKENEVLLWTVDRETLDVKIERTKYIHNTNDNKE